MVFKKIRDGQDPTTGFFERSGIFVKPKIGQRSPIGPVCSAHSIYERMKYIDDEQIPFSHQYYLLMGEKERNMYPVKPSVFLGLLHGWCK
jgi:hypothetical protein